MVYDGALAERIRELLDDERDVIEKSMFGGRAFLIGGNMAVAASRSGGLMVRVDPAESDALTTAPHVTRMVMGGSEMAGWLRVDIEAEDPEVEAWVRRGVDFAAALPHK